VVKNQKHLEHAGPPLKCPERKTEEVKEWMPHAAVPRLCR
jgi:hypothetical protein